MTLSQSPACGRVEERASALERVSGGGIQQYVMGCFIDAVRKKALMEGDVNCVNGSPVRLHGGFC